MEAFKFQYKKSHENVCTQNIKYNFLKIITPLSAFQEVLLSWSIDSAQNVSSNYVVIFANFLHYKQTIYIVLYVRTIKIDGKWIALFELGLLNSY